LRAAGSLFSRGESTISPGFFFSTAARSTTTFRFERLCES
jgi:hypothetical protein